MSINKVMGLVSNQLPGQPNVNSHSFRIDYITQLWKDSKDIEFVEQTVGHRKLDTTSAYVNQLRTTETYRQIKIKSLLFQKCSQSRLESFSDGSCLRDLLIDFKTILERLSTRKNHIYLNKVNKRN